MTNTPIIPVEYFDKLELKHSSRVLRDPSNRKIRFKGKVNPTELAFGEVKVNTVSLPKKARLTNIGLDILHIKEIKLSGDFKFAFYGPNILYPGDFVEVTVSFAPKRLGFSSGSIYLNTGDAAGGEYIRLIGAGIATATPTEPIPWEPEDPTEPTPVDPEDPEEPDPEEPEVPNINPSLNPRNLDFGDVLINTYSEEEEITILNNGTLRLYIYDINTSSEFYQNNDCGSGINPGESCTISIRMNPETIGNKVGTLNILHSGIGPKTASLKGKGVEELEEELTEVSISDAVLIWEDVEVSISDAELVWEGSEVSISDAVLVIEDPEGDLSFNPTSINISNIEIDSTELATFTVTNSGEMPITITEMNVTGEFTAEIEE